MTPRVEPGAVARDGDLDLNRYIRPGDTVVWGQASAEPQTLTELLVAQRHAFSRVRCFVGIPAAETITPDHGDQLTLISYCGTGSNAQLHAAGMLEIVRVRYSALPELLSTGALAADVVLVQVSAPDEKGRHSLGLAEEYLSSAIDNARVVITEINDQVPFTFGARTLSPADWTTCVHSSRLPAEVPPTTPSDDVRAVAEQVAALIDDGATLQIGLGVVPEATLRALTSRVDLGIHSGILNDAAMDLMVEGVATGARKSVDRGVAVIGLIAGTRSLFAYVDRNDAVEVRSTAYTHDHEVLAAQHRLVAINSAIEVDLSGQANAELAGGRYVGAVGGATDFLRGAAASKGGLPVVALPSTSRGTSRIVSRLNGPVSTPGSDVGLVVTEHGVADLRGVAPAERYLRMLAIAHPDHRQRLETELEEHLMTPANVREALT